MSRIMFAAVGLGLATLVSVTVVVKAQHLPMVDRRNACRSA